MFGNKIRLVKNPLSLGVLSVWFLIVCANLNLRRCWMFLKVMVIL